MNRSIARCAARQYGVVTREQALRAGFTPQMIQGRLDRGLWLRVHSCVYRVAGAPITWRQALSAAVLATRERGAVAGQSAAALYGLDGYGQGALELLVPRGMRPRLRGVRVRQTLDLPVRDVVIIEGLRVTSPARTLIDLAATLDPEALQETIDDARRRDLITLERLRRRVGPSVGKGWSGLAVLRAVLDDQDTEWRLDARAERRFLRLFQDAGLTDIAVQRWIRLPSGRRARVDFVSSRHRLVIEIDSWRHHAGRNLWERDVAREGELQEMGFRVLRLAASALGEPTTVIRRVVALTRAES